MGARALTLLIRSMSNTAHYVIFGATGGVGAALSRRLAAAGQSLRIVGHEPETTSRLAAELGAKHSICDAAEPESFAASLRSAKEALGAIDSVAHCVGSLLLKPGHMTTPQEWDETIAVNLSSAFHMLRAAIPVLRENGGSLVFVTSATARLGLANHEAIAAAKAGLIGLALSAAATYGEQGIRVNCVAPGLVAPHKPHHRQRAQPRGFAGDARLGREDRPA